MADGRVGHRMTVVVVCHVGVHVSVIMAYMNRCGMPVV